MQGSFRSVVAFCLGTSALTLPAIAASFSVGGGTITTTQADNSVDNTGSGGGFQLQANTTGSGDNIDISNVTINSPGNRVVDVGGQLASVGSYSVTMHGSSLTGGAGGWFQSTGGLISLDTTGGAANTMSGALALTVSNGVGSGSVSLNLGADTITSTSEAVQAIGANATMSLDMAGTTVISTGTYGVVAQNGVGNLTIGGLNGGISGSITANSGYGIYTSSNGNTSITIAPSGSITALDGIFIGSTASSIDNFGTLAAANNAIAVSFGPLSVTLESGSTTSGKLLGGSGNDTFNIKAGADITSATFDGGGGTNTLNLMGNGNATFVQSSATNINDYQMLGTDIWTLTGSPASGGGWSVASGTLRMGGNLNLNAVIVNGGTFDINGQTVTVGALSGAGGTITLGSGNLITSSAANTSLASVISGGGSLTKSASGTLILMGANTYTGGTIISGGTLQIGNGGTTGSIVGNIINNSSLVFNRSDSITFSGTISGPNVVTQAGTGTLSLRGNNSFGGLKLQSGVVNVVADNNLGNRFGTVGFAGGTLQFGASFNLDPSRAINFNAAPGVIDTNGFDTTISQNMTGFFGFTKTGAGTLTVTNSSTYPGNADTIISGGALQLGNGGSGGWVPSNRIINNATLIYNHSATISFSGVISGTGTVIKAGSGMLQLSGFNTYSGGTTLKAGTLNVLSDTNLGAATGPLTFDGGNLLAGNGWAPNASRVITLNSGGGTITTGPSGGFLLITQGIVGVGRLTVAGAGSLSDSSISRIVLTGTNSYTGGTVIAGNMLQIGFGGTTGSVLGDITDNSILVFNRSNAVAFAGVISGTGLVSQAGTGTLTLSAINTYSGATTVNAGTLNVTGSVANSSISVASEATLSGTGKVGATIVASGGTLAPGNSIGTLSVNGNLTLASGAIYNVEVSPAAADRTNVSGSANLGGSVVASVASGAYNFGQRYTLINAVGGVSGTFASVTGIPISVKGQLSYDANNAYLTLLPNSLTPSLTNPTGNQTSVVSAIDAAVAAGIVPPAGFVALYSLSGPALNSALDQISGQAAPNVTNAVGNSFLSFMSMTASGGSGASGNFAPGSAYGGADAPHRAQLGTDEMRVWGAAYGGHLGLSGDSVSGAASLSSNNVGLIGGADMRVADGILAGVTLGLGRQTFRSGNGTGDSNDLMLGLYGRADVGAAYLAASFGVGWHQIETLRVITVSGTDVLQGKQNADDFGGRIEAGWHVPLDDSYTVTPYGAFAGESFDSPAYAETALSGASTFALSYGAQTTTLGRSELGAHLNRSYGLEQGVLTADVRTAWAHQLDDLPFTQASFIGLPGAAFQVAGVRPAPDTALLGLDLEVQNNSGLFFGLHGEGQFGAGTTAVEGLGNFGWRW